MLILTAGEPRELPRNKGRRLPSSLICFDTETLPLPHPSTPGVREHRLRLGVASHVRLDRGEVHGQSWHTFFTPDSFWQWVYGCLRPRTSTWVFAHNLAFDGEIVGLRQLLQQGDLLFECPAKSGQAAIPAGKKKRGQKGLFIDGDPPTVYKLFTPTGHALTFVDTLNYFQSSLKTLGHDIGIEKLPMPPWEAPDEEWEVYCKRDVEVTLGAVLHWIRAVRDLDLGGFALTVAGQSHNAFRHRFYTHRIVLHQKAEVQALEHDGLFGGQTECYYVGETPQGPIHELDVSALYPWVCYTYSLPVQLGVYREATPLDWTPPYGWDHAIAEVDLDSPTDGYPIHLPKGVAFAVGRYRTTLPGPELSRAITLGQVVRIHRVSVYRMARFASDYMLACWEGRLKEEAAGHQAMSHVWKILANSFWGKFTQKLIDWEDAPGVIPPCDWGSWETYHAAGDEVVYWRSLGGKAQYRVDKGFARNAFVAIGAFVTSYARERMRELRMIAGAGEVYHQAVDSLLCSDAALQNLTSAGEVKEREWGTLRLKRTADRAIVLGVNIYKHGSKNIHGPIKASAVEVEPNVFRQIQFERLAGMLGRTPDLTVRERDVLKHLTPGIGLRSRGPDGWTLPRRLG